MSQYQDTDAQLPDGWAAVALGSIAQPSSEKVEPQKTRATHYLSLEHIASNTNQVLACGKPSDVRSTKSVFKCGDVLYGKLRPYLNKVCVPQFDGVCSTDILVFPKRPEIESKYLMWFLSQPAVVEHATHNSSGVQLPRVNFASLADLIVPLPPAAEQRRIIEKSEELVARVNAVRQRLAKVPAILQQLRQSVLAAACSGRLTEDWRRDHPLVDTLVKTRHLADHDVKLRRGVPDKVEMPEEVQALEVPATWTIASCAELLRSGLLLDVKDGNHGSSHPKTAEFTAKGLPFITAAQVANYSIDYEGAPRVAGPALARLRVGFAQPQDAILTHKGSVGRAALNTRRCVLTPQTTYYRCNPNFLDARYLVYYFTCPFFYAQLAAVMSQTTRDFVPISEQYRLFIVIPPLPEQVEIVRRVESILSIATVIDRRVTLGAARAEKLTQSILAKAFRGELVPTEAELAHLEGRGYETASELLARVRATRGEMVKPNRGRGRRRKKPTRSTRQRGAA